MYGDRFQFATMVASLNSVAWDRMYGNYNAGLMPNFMFDGGLYNKFGTPSSYLNYLELLDSACVRPVDSVELTVSVTIPLPSQVQTTVTLRYLPSYACCALIGDIDHNATGPDISDLVYLVTYMFQGGPEPQCMAEANIDGLGSDIPDISDLVYLVTYMFQDGPALPFCPVL